VLLQKTMVVVEGVARSLDPHLNLWSAAEPVVNEWIAENIGPKAVITDFRDSTQHLLRALPKVTELIERASESRELKSSEKRQPAFFPLSLHLALWVAVLLLAINIGVLLK